MEAEKTRYGSEQAGLLCGYLFSPDQPGRPIGAEEAAAFITEPGGDAADAFIWLHFNLSNQASRRWLGDHLWLPEAFHSALDHTKYTRVEVAEGFVVAVLNDVTHFGAEASEVSTMATCITDRFLISVRHTPLQSVDRLRAAVLAGERFHAPMELLAHLLGDQADILARTVRAMVEEVDDIEDRLIANRVSSSRPKLGALRRRLVRLQRLLAPEPSALLRLLSKPPSWMSANDLAELRGATDRLAAAIADCVALVDRIKLLQDEVYAVVSEQTNRTLFILTVVTVLALPMTIVSGFFGMNFSRVPLQDRTSGFWVIVGFTLGLSALGAILLFRGRDNS